MRHHEGEGPEYMQEHDPAVHCIPPFLTWVPAYSTFLSQQVALGSAIRSGLGNAASRAGPAQQALSGDRAGCGRLRARLAPRIVASTDDSTAHLPVALATSARRDSTRHGRKVATAVSQLPDRLRDRCGRPLRLAAGAFVTA